MYNPEAIRAYALDLSNTAAAYRTAADAPGLRKDAAAFLRNEAARLDGESERNFRRADEVDGIRAHEGLRRFIVTLVSGQKYRFWAEDAGHAIEQAANAEPTDKPVAVNLDNDGSSER